MRELPHSRDVIVAFLATVLQSTEGEAGSISKSSVVSSITAEGVWAREQQLSIEEQDFL